MKFSFINHLSKLVCVMVLLSGAKISRAADLAASASAETNSQMPLPLVPGAKVVTLWPAGSPTLKNLDQKEFFTFNQDRPGHVQMVTNVNNPSIELHLAPPDKANGMAVILAPGGGNTKLVVGGEGVEVANYLNGLGVSAFILRYRLQPYRSSVEGLADTQQSIRLVRANAKEWGVDPHKIGVMGFSAGGEQAARAVLFYDAGDPAASDPVEKTSGRPDFAVLIYPGWRELDLSHVQSNTPPVFIASAGVDDASSARCALNFYNAVFEAKIPIEIHIYRHGGHAGGIRPRNGIPFGTWPKRFEEWAADIGMLKKE